MIAAQAPIEQFGGVVKAQRKAKGWSQQQLAQAAGLSRPTVARIESGSAVSTATLAKIANALGIEIKVKAEE
jgi:HTH-type transcriptional regulator/antitoxin HipB